MQGSSVNNWLPDVLTVLMEDVERVMMHQIMLIMLHWNPPSARIRSTQDKKIRVHAFLLRSIKKEGCESKASEIKPVMDSILIRCMRPFTGRMKLKSPASMNKWFHGVVVVCPEWQ